MKKPKNTMKPLAGDIHQAEHVYLLPDTNGGMLEIETKTNTILITVPRGELINLQGAIAELLSR